MPSHFLLCTAKLNQKMSTLIWESLLGIWPDLAVTHIPLLEYTACF